MHGRIAIARIVPERLSWRPAAADAVVGPLREKSFALFADVLLEEPTITTYDVWSTPGSTTVSSRRRPRPGLACTV